MTSPPTPTQALLPALLALAPLEHLPRTGWTLRGVASPETVGAHVLSTAFVVLALGPRVQPALDVDRALALTLVHDVPEALLGDLPRTAAELFPPGAKRAAEERAAERLLPPLSETAWQRWREFHAGESREARFVRVCDRLQLGLKLVAYERSGVRGLEEFHDTLARLDCAEFEPAEALRREILIAIGRA